jgi:hypothetical protein
VSGSFSQFTAGYLDPNNPAFDRGNCSQNRTHIGNITVGAQSPHYDNALGLVVSDWRLSGILNARSGSWLTVTTGRDINGSGIGAQRVDQVNDNPYGDKSLTNYLSAAAFAYPAAGTLGNEKNYGVTGPGFWTVDMALTRLVNVSAQQSLEFRVEVFNLFNNFNWGNPATNLDAGTFGRITTASGDPRIMQFGFKYGF